MGYLLHGRYKAILVDKDSYLLELCRYVVLNPVRAGLVSRPEEWRWSSYEGTIDERRAIACLTTDWLLSQFDEGRGEATSEYRAFVYEGLKEDSPWRALRGQVFLGGDSFAEKKEIAEISGRALRYDK